MSPLHIILLLTLFQIISYLLIDNYFKINGKTLVLLLLLIGYFFVIPNYFINQEISTDGKPKCGMPILAINFAFWFLGGGGAILTHLVYVLLAHLSSKKN